MKYIVLDMEWNQPFNIKKMVKNPVFLRGEIIQIGAVKLDENYHILDTFKIMVLPKYYTKMNKKVTMLTKITTEELQYGFPFKVAFKHFQKWCGDEITFLTWGNDDITMLRDNMILHKINTDWIPNTYNVQRIFDSQITMEKRQVSLLYAMEKIGELPLEAHDALHDARNTVSVCLHLDMDKGLKEYSDLIKEDRACRKYRTGIKNEYIGKYSTMDAAIKDQEVVNFFSSELNSNVKCADIVRQNYSKFICIGRCENGEELFVRFKFKKCSDGNFSATRIIYEMNDDHRNYYVRKKQLREEAKAEYLQRISIAG